MQQLTLAEVLDLPALRHAGAQVVAAQGESLVRTVRWLHASDLPDVAPLLRPGDLVLTTGSGFPADDRATEFDAYASDLQAAGAAGVIVELGRRWHRRLPHLLVDAFERAHLPLVSLAHEVRFAAITQAVGELIVDRQLAELRDAERVHEIFTELSFTQAGPPEVLDAVQRLAGATVVVENEQHQILDYLAGPGDVSSFLEDWSVRSTRVHVKGRTGWDSSNGWLVTLLGAGDRSWGRIVIESPTPPPQRLVAVAERAAAALALHRLHRRDRDNLVRRTHFELISRLSRGSVSDDLLRRCKVAGFPVVGRKFVAFAVRPRPVETGDTRRASVDEIIATAVQGCSALRTPALVCEIDETVQVLLSCPERTDADRVTEQLGARVSRRHGVLMSAGRAVKEVESVERTLLEARQVIGALSASADITVVHRLEDVHVRGLLALLADDERLRLFVERELQALTQHDAESTVKLSVAVRALLWHPSNKTDAAASLHLSRAAFYSRLERAEQLLGVELDDPDVRLSLHLALLARDMAAQRET